MTSTAFTENATSRASKVLSFDSSGELAVTNEIGNFKGNWATSTAFVLRDIVIQNSTSDGTTYKNVYICTTAHTSTGSYLTQNDTYFSFYNHEETKIQAIVERAFLKVLDGSCRTPIGSISKIDDKKIFLSGQVLKPDGSEIISGNWEGLVDKPIDLGKMAGNEIKEKIDDSFFKKENLSY